MPQTLTIALSQGRILKEALLLDAAGIRSTADAEIRRRWIYPAWPQWSPSDADGRA
jgi:hypothetical protein